MGNRLISVLYLDCQIDCCLGIIDGTLLRNTLPGPVMRVNSQPSPETRFLIMLVLRCTDILESSIPSRAFIWLSSTIISSPGPKSRVMSESTQSKKTVESPVTFWNAKPEPVKNLLIEKLMSIFTLLLEPT